MESTTHRVLLAAMIAATLAPATRAQDAPASNLDYWLRQAATAPADGAATAPAEGGANPFAPAGPAGEFSRRDALPGAVVFSDGRIVAGGLYTTAGKDWEVWVEAEQRWRHVPPLAVRGIEAVIVAEEMEPEWRWREMGSDEKLFTGRQRPTRRLAWRLNLVDGTSIEGAIKGQPLWIETDAGRTLVVLQERTRGEFGQSLEQLAYPRHIYFSRRVMLEARARAAPPAAEPQGGE